MKLNQFAVYRVNQQTEGKVLWHLPYQEAIQQNVSITVENYRLISIHEMQENEKVADIWKRMKKQCEVSDVLVLNKNGEISCYYVDENYPQYLAGFIRINTSGALITMEKISDARSNKQTSRNQQDNKPKKRRSVIKRLHQKQIAMGDKSRTSNMHFGMGLYITSSIIKQHGGQLVLSNSKKTGGAQVTIKIPY